jgi:hypothetical protein
MAFSALANENGTLQRQRRLMRRFRNAGGITFALQQRAACGRACRQNLYFLAAQKTHVI